MSKKISELAELLTVDGANSFLHVVESGDNWKITPDNFIAAVGGGGGGGGVSLQGIMMKNFQTQNGTYTTLAWNNDYYYQYREAFAGQWDTQRNALATAGWEPSTGNFHQFQADEVMYGIDGTFRLVLLENSADLGGTIPGNFVVQLGASYWGTASPHDTVGFPRTETIISNLNNITLPSPLSSSNSFINFMFQFNNPADKPGDAYVLSPDDPNRIPIPFVFVPGTNVFLGLDYYAT